MTSPSLGVLFTHPQWTHKSLTEELVQLCKLGHGNWIIENDHDVGTTPPMSLTQQLLTSGNKGFMYTFYLRACYLPRSPL